MRPLWPSETVMIDKKLLSILVCPVSKAPLEYDREKNELVCKASGLAYPVRDGIPVMLESEARVLTADEKLG
jgi:uncharacterized protein YbaR (Trm112 family)